MTKLEYLLFFGPVVILGVAVIYLLNRVNRLEQVLALQTWTLDITKRHAALLDRMLAKQLGISNDAHPHGDKSPILTSLFKPGEMLPPDKLLERIDKEG